MNLFFYIGVGLTLRRRRTATATTTTTTKRARENICFVVFGCHKLNGSPFFTVAQSKLERQADEMEVDELNAIFTLI